MNPELTTISGFPLLTEVIELEIAVNPRLPTCVAHAFADRLIVQTTPIIADNLPDTCGG